MPDGLISIKKLYPSLCDELILWKSNNRIATTKTQCFFNYMYSVINEKKSSPVSSFTTLIFFLTAVGHVTLVHLFPFPECQRGLFRCDR